MNTAFCCAFLARVLPFLRAAIGDISWQRPRWIARLGERAQAHRRRLLLSAIVLSGLFATFGTAYLIYVSLPHPQEVAVKIAPPDLSAITSDGLVVQPLAVNFAGSAAKLADIGKTVIAGASIEPNVPGKWRWTSDRQLLFVPDSAFDWPAGRSYQVALDRSLFPAYLRLERYRIPFTTRPFGVQIEGHFYVDPTHPASPQITGTLQFSHPVTQKEVADHLALTGKAVSLLGAAGSQPLSIELDSFGRVAYFRSGAVRLPVRQSYIQVELGAGTAPADGGAALPKTATMEVTVPSRSSLLAVTSAELRIVRNPQGDPEQTLLITTSSGISTGIVQKNLSIYLLPKRDAAWQTAAEVTDGGALKEAVPVPFQLAPQEIDAPTLQNAKLDVPEGRQLYLRLNGGIEGLGGFILEKGYDTVLAVPDYPREVRIVHDGAVLTLSGERKISLIARGVDSVECRVGKVSDAEINHLVSQSEGSFQNPIFENASFGEDDVAESFVKKLKVDGSNPAKANYIAFDFSEFLDRDKTASGYGLFFFRAARDLDLEHFPENESRWNQGDDSTPDDADQRFILVTDLGLLVKENADHSREVFVTSLKNGGPVAGAAAEILGKNGLPVAQGVTDASGRASLPNVSDLLREKAPVAIVVRKGNDLAFLPYAPRDRQLDFSRYDVGGIELADPAQLNAYLFSDRGIYRPGDPIHIGAVVKQFDWQGNLEGLPLEIAVRNPAGQDVKVERIRWPAAGLLDWGYTPKASAPTGLYTVGIYTIRDGKRDVLLGETTVRVEEFLPDRMKIAAALDRPVPAGWLSPENLKLAVSLHNLYGTPAAEHRINGEFTLQPAEFSFDAYPDYLFLDPGVDGTAERRAFQADFPETQTDGQGAASLSIAAAGLDGGAYRLDYIVRGFEAEGGRSVTTGGSVLVSPRPFLLGMKADRGAKLDFLQVGSAHAVSLLAVDPDLKPVAAGNLSLALCEEKYVSVLTRQPNGDYAYESVLREKDLGTTPLDVPVKGFAYALATQNPGTFVARVHDAQGLLLASIRFVVVGNANLTRSIDKDAELVAHIPQRSFDPGEEIPVSIVAPYAGSGVITLERDRVYAQSWFHADSTSSVQKIAIPKDFEGNGYLNVTFIRAADAKEIFMSPLSTAVIPFSVNREKRTIHVDLQAPEKAEPGHPFAIAYKTDRPCKIVVFAVDEGILKVAHYQTPDPLGAFFQKRALQVKTTQILDLVLPEFSLDRIVAAAGGDGGEDLLAANLNPFKRKSEQPVVFWSGILDASSTARTATYDVPDYFNGTLRIMAVAVRPDAVGASERSALIRGPFVISPNVPTFVAPGDAFDVTVSVANTLAGSGADAKISFAAEPSAGLRIVAPPAAVLSIPEGKETTVRIRMQAAEGADALGDADLVFTASAGGKASRYASHLSIRPPLPYRTTVQSGICSGESVEVPLTRALYPQYRKLQATFSTVPLGFVRGLLAYLDDYPHLCTEQLSSRGLPLAVLDLDGDLGPSRAEREKAIATIVEILGTRQNDQGAFGLWAVAPDLHFDFPSIYAMHFLTEAREAGYEVPPDLFSRGLDHLKQIASETPSNQIEARNQAYAIYLLTRNQVVATNELDRVCSWLDQRDPAHGWHNELAGLYCASSYALLQDNKDAARIIAGFRFGHPNRKPAENDYFYSDLGRDGQYLALAARHFPARLATLSPEDLLAVAKPITDSSYTTHAAAYAVLGLQAYATLTEKAASGESGLAASERLADGTLRPLAAGHGVAPLAAFSGEAKAIRFEKQGSRTPYLFYQVIESGFDQGVPTQPLARGIEVEREYRDGSGKVLASVQLGEECQVVLRIRSIDGGYHDNLAILDLLPGGFEVVGDSLHGGGSSFEPESIDGREDRVVLYGCAGPEVREFTYRIKATNQGCYQVPPVQAESMYHPEIVSRSLPGSIRVEGAP